MSNPLRKRQLALIRLVDAFIKLKQLGGEHHQNCIVGDFKHLVPVLMREQKTLVRCIQDKVLRFGAGMVGNKATPFQTNDRLLRMSMPVFELIGTIDIEDTLDFKRNNALDYRQASAGVRKGFQIN
jgi:hypothetical protein